MVVGFKTKLGVIGVSLPHALLLFACLWIGVVEEPVDSSPLALVDQIDQAEAMYQDVLALIEQGKYVPARQTLIQVVTLWRDARQDERARQALLEMGRRYKRA